MLIDWESYGFHVVGKAAGGEQALSILRQNRCDLLLTDIRMPGLDGFSLIEQIEQMQLNPNLRIIIISGYREFSYAKKALEHHVHGYLLKPVDESELVRNILDIKEEWDRTYLDLRATMENRRMAVDKLFSDLIHGRMTAEQVFESLSLCGVEVSGAAFLVTILEIENFYTILEQDVQEANLMKYGVCNILEELAAEQPGNLVFECQNGRIGVLTHSADARLDAEDIRRRIQGFAAIIYENIQVRLLYGCGTVVDNRRHIPLSGQQAEMSLERSIMDNYAEASPFREADDKSALGAFRWNTQKLLYHLEEGDCDNAIQEIGELLDECVSRQLPADVLKNVVYNTIFEIISLPRKLGLVDNGLYYIERFNDLKKLSLTIKGIKSYLNALCRDICAILENYQAGRKNNIVGQIQSYVEEHYREELNLQLISQKFYMSPVYLGRVFKNATGESFSEYVNKCRIRKIKELLTVNNGRILDMISAMGFQNQEYFYRLFKKYEGISFADYRKSRLEENQAT